MPDRRVDPPRSAWRSGRPRIETDVKPDKIRITGTNRIGTVAHNIVLTDGEFDAVVRRCVAKGAGREIRAVLRRGDQAIGEEAITGGKGNPKPETESRPAAPPVPPPAPSTRKKAARKKPPKKKVAEAAPPAEPSAPGFTEPQAPAEPDAADFKILDDGGNEFAEVLSSVPDPGDVDDELPTADPGSGGPGDSAA